MENPETTRDFLLRLPNSCALIGSSNSGKTVLLARILKNLKEVAFPCPDVSAITICYGVYQDLYDDMINSIKKLYPDVKVELYGYYPKEKFADPRFWKTPRGCQQILIIDDLSEQIDEGFVQIMRKYLHHYDTTLFYLSQVRRAIYI